jgi:hypothetical protein
VKLSVWPPFAMAEKADKATRLIPVRIVEPATVEARIPEAERKYRWLDRDAGAADRRQTGRPVAVRSDAEGYCTVATTFAPTSKDAVARRERPHPSRRIRARAGDGGRSRADAGVSRNRARPQATS